jgi:hypothetical protein
MTVSDTDLKDFAAGDVRPTAADGQEMAREILRLRAELARHCQVSTSELTPAEVVFARAAGQLYVDENGFGSVPGDWLRRWREQAEEASRLTGLRLDEARYADPRTPHARSQDSGKGE